MSSLSPQSASPTRNAPVTVARALAGALANHVAHAFGLMGNGNAHLIDGLAEAGVPFTAARHEAGTVAAADAYTRVSGRIALATTTYGAGFTNTLTALAEAVQARTPMLVAVGDAPSGGPRPWDVDQEILSAALGVPSFRVSASGIATTVVHAASTAMRTRRPVVIGIPYGLATAPADAASASPATASPGSSPGATAVDAGLDEAVDVLARAERPLVLAGRGAWLAGAGAELGRLAEALGALTATTALARGIFPEPRYDLGVTGGFGQQHAMATVAEADVVVVVGASLGQFTMRFGDLFASGATVIRIDHEKVAPPETNQTITHVLLQGDARASLREMLGALADAGHRSSGWREHVAGLEPGGALRVRGSGLEEHRDGLCADGRLDPRPVAARLAELLPEERHVTSDGGHFIGWANMYWPVASPERMIMVGTAYQTIGLGFSTVAGVAAAAPGTTVVLSTGDGGGLMALADLETAIRASDSCVIVVWNDGAYGAEVHLYGAMGLDPSPMLIPDVDFAALATALDARGVRVNRLEDLGALGDWVAEGAEGTILLDCRVSRSIVAPYQREIQRVNGLDVE